MKFRFCGDSDCPDWVLAEIIATLSVLTAKQLETLAELVLRKILGQAFEEDAIKALTTGLAGDGKSAVACIHYLLMNAARYHSSESIFVEEIQQLGLPKEHALGLGSLLNSKATALREVLAAKAFKINELIDVSHVADRGNTLDCERFEFRISNELVNGLPQNTSHVISVERTQLKALLDELKLASSLMHKYEAAPADTPAASNNA